jgi:hypothetical protein
MTTKMQSCATTAITPILSFTPVRSGLLQRKCACGGTPGPSGECDGCRKKRLQRKAGNSEYRKQNDSFAPPIVHEVLRSPGQPLDPNTRAFMEPRFGHDFSQVRVHSDSKAAESARAVNSLAYTVGNNVVFGSGRCEPNSKAERRLMAHELSHVVQQSSRRGVATINQELAISRPDEAAEREADRISQSLVSESTSTKGVRPGVLAAPTLQRTCADGRCEDCAGGRRDFWVTVFFRRRANAATIAKLRTEINGAKAILANCCLDLKFDFDWSLLRGPSTFPAGTARPAGDPLGGWDYPAAAEALGEGLTFSGARGVPMLVVDDVPGSGGGVTMIRGLDAEYTGRNYFAIAVNQPSPNPNCNHIAHELWHMTGAPGHNPADGPITACTSNAVSLTYCNALRAMVSPRGDFPLPVPATSPGATRIA